MDQEIQLSISAFPQQLQSVQEGNRSDASQSYSSDTNEREHVFITSIRATDVVGEPRRLPAGFYVVVEINGKTTVTANKPVLIDKDGEVEWHDEILLPLNPSSVISFRVYASVELGPRLGNGELLQELKISVGEVVRGQNEQPQSIRIPVHANDVFPSFSSLRITTERRIRDVNKLSAELNVPESNGIRQLDQLYDATDLSSEAAELSPTESYAHLAGRVALQMTDVSVPIQAMDAGMPAQGEVDSGDPIARLRGVLQSLPRSNLRRATLLANLGTLLYLRFENIGNLGDIHEAILTLDHAIRLHPNGDPDKLEWLNNLGNSLLRRFEHLGDLADINRSISIFEEPIRLTPDGHFNKPALLTNLGNSLMCRFDRLGDLADIIKAVSIFEEAIHLSPDDYPYKPALLSNFGHSLSRRFKRLGDLTDINRSISVFEEAVCLTPDDHSNKPDWLNNLGMSLLRRFERLGDLADIEKSISIEQDTVHLTPDSHPDKPLRLTNFGNSLFSRFQRLANLADLDKSISMYEEAVRLTPDGHTSKSYRLSNLGSALSSRFGRLGDLTDVDKSILMIEEAVRLTPDDHPEKPSWLDNLGNSFVHRFEHIGDLKDLNKSISMMEKAVYLTPDDHTHKPGLLNNLGNSLFRRFERLGDVADINRSISMREEAIRLTPDNGHPDKPLWLNSLGDSLLSRFEHLANLTDLVKSISMNEEAVRLTPEGHPSKSRRLGSLGNSLICRFERLVDREDFNKAVSMFEEAIHLTPDDHPSKPHWLDQLGRSFMKRFWDSRDPSHLSIAISHLSIASRASTAPTSTHFRAASCWISSAKLQNNSQSLLDAYATAMNLLPQLAWMGLPLTERHRLLAEAAHVARDAAAASLNAGHSEMAIEWLEQGRSVVWSQFLQLRTPVNELCVDHPTLARQFQQVSEELESASSRDNSEDNQMATRITSLEEEVQRHHALALRREKLLVEIRSLPGFERFLLPKKFEQLAALASSGPIVYLNASHERCDALVIKPGSSGVLPVSLPDVSYRDVQVMLCLMLQRNYPRISREDISALIPSEENPLSLHSLYALLMDDGIECCEREGGPQEVEEYTPDDRFRRVLAFLWRRVVNPVLVALGISSQASPSGVQNITHIFWCPTGPFAFLPIHAAGLYGPTTPTGAKLSDFAISSYIPTLTTTLTASSKKDSNYPSSNIRLLAVPQPPGDGQSKLPGAKEEISYIKALSAKFQSVSLQNSDGSIEDSIAKMTNADWVHFACHGVQDPVEPLDSGLCLANRRRLKLSDIIRMSRPQGGLAFLSACQTAQGDEQLPEESVHLAAGMLLAGYDGVIATMWAIRDRDAPKVARDVYTRLFRDGKVPDTREAAEALHYAVQYLRDSGASFTSWVPFIHLGR